MSHFLHAGDAKTTLIDARDAATAAVEVVCASAMQGGASDDVNKCASSNRFSGACVLVDLFRQVSS